MKTIGQVLDLDGMRTEIADLGDQVAAPDLWDDQDNATRVTGRLSTLQGELDRFNALASRIEDLEIMVELGTDWMWSTVAFTIVLSVMLHGVLATPVMKRLDLLHGR